MLDYSQKLQTSTQVTPHFLTVIPCFRKPINDLSTISVIYYWIEDAVYLLERRIRYLEACAVENVSNFHFLQV